jgi:hypothetical protein
MHLGKGESKIKLYKLVCTRVYHALSCRLQPIFADAAEDYLARGCHTAYVAFDAEIKVSGEHAKFELHVELQRSFIQATSDCQCKVWDLP